MAGKARSVSALIKYGPIVYAAAQKYGPTVLEQLRSQREPAERFVQTKVARGNQRKKALAHADTVVAGTVLQVFHRSEAHWVVFSGEEPVGVHPPTSAPYPQLLRNADLSKRLRPEDAQRIVRLPRRRRRNGAASRSPGTSSRPSSPATTIRLATGDARPEGPRAEGSRVEGSRTGPRPAGPRAEGQRPTA